MPAADAFAICSAAWVCVRSSCARRRRARPRPRDPCGQPPADECAYQRSASASSRMISGPEVRIYARSAWACPEPPSAARPAHLSAAEKSGPPLLSSPGKKSLRACAQLLRDAHASNIQQREVELGVHCTRLRRRARASVPPPRSLSARRCPRDSIARPGTAPRWSRYGPRARADGSPRPLGRPRAGRFLAELGLMLKPAQPDGRRNSLFGHA